MAKRNSDHFVATATNFVPKKELWIGFFHVFHKRFLVCRRIGGNTEL